MVIAGLCTMRRHSGPIGRCTATRLWFHRQVIGIQPVSVYAWVKWRHSNLWSGHFTISMLWGNTAYRVKLSGEELSRYSNKSESVGLRKYPCYHCRIKEVMSQYIFSKIAPHDGGKTAGIDMVWRNYVSVALCKEMKKSDGEMLWVHRGS